MMGYGLGMTGLGWLWMLIFWGVIILLAVGLVSLIFPAGQKSPPASSSGSALDILKERFARGELTAEQFKQMRQTIEQPYLQEESQ